jgi:NAD(P)H dehydrogenase (quinone)
MVGQIKKEKMKIAVTAASGELGSAIIKKLLEEMPKEHIIGLARTPKNAEKLGVEIRPGDYNNKAGLIESLNGVEAVLMVSGMDAPDKRIAQHQNVINAAKEAGVGKIVYTSIFGEKGNTSFSPIISSNRRTEEDIKSSGLKWVIGRNGLYIEPDLEYMDNYIKAGKISNCAADGKCSYTTRDELATAYSRMLLEDKHNGNTYNLCGQAITQQQLTDYLNSAFETDLVFESLSVDEYAKERQSELGDFLGTVIAGIYSGIRDGGFNVKSDFYQAVGREHVGWDEFFNALRLKIQSGQK